MSSSLSSTIQSGSSKSTDLIADQKILNDVSQPLVDADEHRNTELSNWSEDHTWISAEKFDIIRYDPPIYENPVEGWWCPNEDLTKQDLLNLNLDSAKKRQDILCLGSGWSEGCEKVFDSATGRCFEEYTTLGGSVYPPVYLCEVCSNTDVTCPSDCGCLIRDTESLVDICQSVKGYGLWCDKCVAKDTTEQIFTDKLGNWCIEYVPTL